MSGEHENGAAYLLGALDEAEVADFERHLAGCARCREEVERLRPAADALPRSVTPLAPPPTLKASLMEAVEGRAPARRSLGERLRGLIPDLGGMRPAAAWVSAAFLLAVGIAAGFGVAGITGGDDTRTLQASVDEARAPEASASLRVYDDGEKGAALRANGLPKLPPGRVYQAWVQRGREIVPEATFDVSRDGRATTAVLDDVSDADAVMVTREPRGGSRAPSEEPLLRISL